MSQIYKIVTAGTLPPSVPTSFVTQNGTAVPAANVLIVNAFDSIENNANGIITKGGVVGTGTANEVDVVITNRIQITATTSDGGGQTQNVNLLTPPNSSSSTFKMRVSGYDAVNNETSGGELVGVSRTSSGGVLVVIGTNDTFVEEDVGLNTSVWDVVDTASPILQAEFTGVAGRTVVWTALFEYTRSP